jgi:D,D-heptose 1,7-bisphosphate phosphatase
MLDDEFLLLNGDSFFDFNLMDLAALPMGAGTLMRMALKREQAGDRYGRLDIAGDRVRRFLPPTAATSGPINAGVYVMRRRILDRIAAMPCSLEQAVLPELAERGMLEARPYDGYFIDIGVPADFERAQEELPRRRRRPAVFFDRDGVLNKDDGYVHRIEDFHWLEGAREAVKLCNDRGYLVFVVTNQAGVARGYYGVDAIERLHAWMDERLAEVGAHVDEYQYCPYHEQGTVTEFAKPSDRRKPAPGMLLDCLRGWPVDAGRSFLVGDRASDIAAAKAAGVPGHLLAGGNLADFVARCMGNR